MFECNDINIQQFVNWMCEVHLSFLYVGHTHEDIDAAFSRIAEKLRTEDAETLPKLLHVLQGGRKLQGLFDIKQCMEPHINQIKHHYKPLHFLFSKHAEGDVCVLYKGNSRRPWKRLECTILNNVPVGKPVVLLPSKVNKINISAIRSNVERCRYRMPGGDGQYQWWVRFLNEMSEISQSQQRMKEYASAQAYWLLPNLKNKVFLHSITAPEINVAEHLQEMADKELEDPLVVASIINNKNTSGDKIKRRL